MPVTSTLTPIGDVVTLGNANFRRKFRAYTVRIVRDATADKQFQGQIQIDPNLAPFLCTRLHAADTADGKTITSQECWLIQATDNENGYLWADGLVERSSFFGSREFGFNFPDTFAIRANTRINWTLQNMSAVIPPTAGTAIITLEGWQLIPM